MKCSVINVSPALATRYLTRNVGNRRISRFLVNAYAQDMKNGNWQLNGEPITFNKSGFLTNGQHRLLAVIKSGATVPMLVIEGVDDDVAIYDRGRKRSCVDTLVLSGVDRTKARASFIAVVRMVAQISLNTKDILILSDTDVMDFILANADTLERSELICGQNNSKSAVKTKNATFMTAVFYALKCDVSVEVLTRFIKVVQSGMYDSKNETPAVVLRNDILQSRLPSRSQTDRVNCIHTIERAIHDFVKGSERKKSYGICTEPIYSTVEIDWGKEE